MRHLILLRHGKADSPAGVGDFDRPLKKRGGRDSFRIGEWLRGQALVPDLIMTSSAARTLETADRVLEGLEVEGIALEKYRELYLAPPDRLFGAARQAPDAAQTVLMIGHNPGMAMVASELSGQFLEFPTCAMAVFRIDGNWAGLGPERADLTHHILPRRLAEAGD